MTSKIKLVLVGLLILISAVYLMPIKDRAVYVSGDTYIDPEVLKGARASNILWTELSTSTPWSTRDSAASFVFKDKMYLMGGMNLSGETFNDLWSSEDGLSWQRVSTPSWQSRQGHELLVYNDYLWVIGRLDDNKEGGDNDVWYSKDGIDWRKTNTNPPWLGREDHSALVYKNQIFIFGGMDKNWRWRNDVWSASF